MLRAAAGSSRNKKEAFDTISIIRRAEGPIEKEKIKMQTGGNGAWE